MTIYYSATTNAFYDSQVYNVNNIPEDKVAVAESTYKNLMAQQCAGRVIVAAADGTPTTIVQTCGPCTSTKYATKTELANGLAAKANDSNVVHKTGDERINGVKSFGSAIKATNGTVQVGADTGYSVTFNHNGNITSKQARGTYNIFFPEGSGTLALTSDIDDKANDNNVVHKTGDETIEGVKKFTSDIMRKYTAVDITTTPTSDMYAHINFTDKNEKTVAYIQYAQKTNGVDYIGLRVRDKNSDTLGVQLNTNKEFVPLGNNSYSLGSSSYKWADAYISNIYTNRVTTYSITHPGGDNDSHFYMSGGSEWDKGATVILHGEESSEAGVFKINSRDKTRSLYLIGKPDGTLQWAGRNIALDENLVHRTGNEFISGLKTFTDTICKNNSTSDLQVNPSSDQSNSFIFTDKNHVLMSYLEHVQTTTGVNVLGLITRDKNNVSHGIQVTSDDNAIPLGNGVVNLGLSSRKWKNVYATTFTGNLKGNADTATKATSADSVAWANVTGKPNLATTTFVKGTNYWYRKHSDGFIEMGGFTNCGDKTGYDVATNMPLAFSNTDYTLLVQLTRGASGGERWGNDYSLPFTQKKTTTGFVVYSHQLTETDGFGGYDWYACGY